MRLRPTMLAIAALCLAMARPALAQDTPVKGRPCLFLHGLGTAGKKVGFSSKPPNVELLDGSMVPYWGKVESELAGVCSSFEYANFVESGGGAPPADWRDADVQRAYYERAKAVYDKGGVVFAHSMASNILGGACMSQKLCAAKWYSLGGPIRGSRAAKVQSPRLSTGSVLPMSLDPSVAGLGDSGLAQVIASKQLLKGGVCGTSGWGGGGAAGAALIRIVNLAYGPASDACRAGEKKLSGPCNSWHDIPADGVVHVDECARYQGTGASGKPETMDLGKFSQDPASPFFLVPSTHYDLTGSGGNHNNIFDWMRGAATRG